MTRTLGSGVVCARAVGGDGCHHAVASAKTSPVPMVRRSRRARGGDPGIGEGPARTERARPTQVMNGATTPPASGGGDQLDRSPQAAGTVRDEERVGGAVRNDGGRGALAGRS